MLAGQRRFHGQAPRHRVPNRRDPPALKARSAYRRGMRLNRLTIAWQWMLSFPAEVLCSVAEHFKCVHRIGVFHPTNRFAIAKFE
jgi:hypothetical protein